MPDEPVGSPPTYDEANAPHPAIRFTGSASEREEATRYGEGARFLRQEQDDDDESDNDSDIVVMEQMEVEEPSSSANRQPSIASRAGVVGGRVLQSINSKIFSPVQRILIDPVAQLWAHVNTRFDEFLARFGNPLMFRRLIYLMLVAFGIFAVVSTGVLTTDGLYTGQFHNQGEIRRLITGGISTAFIKSKLEYLSSMSHMVGTAGDITLAGYVREEFESFGLRMVDFEELEMYITFPNEKESEMVLEMDGHKAKLWEEPLYKSPKKSQKVPRPFHALSPKGDVKGPIVFAEFGRESDYKDLDVKDAVVFMKYGKLEPGLKVMLAEKKGAKGVVMFNEQDKEGGWPNGKGYPDGAVQRAHVAVPAMCPGDILTPGWSTLDSSQALSIDQVKNVPSIPSIPISWKEVKPFLDRIKSINHGKGSVEKSPTVRLKNNPVVEERHKAWNVFGKIEGKEQPEKMIVIGAQRDAFVYGAVEPMSSTAILLQLAKSFAALQRKHNWAPLRSIYFASWDGTEHNLGGSTEWVEYNADTLANDGVIYIDLNNVWGDELMMSAHPSVKVQQVMNMVNEPVNNKTLAMVWGDKQMPTIGSDGDHLAFTAHAGIPSISIGFGSTKYPKHSCYDSLEWVEKFSGFEYHRVLAEFAAGLLLKYSDEPVIDFDVEEYARRVNGYVKDLEKYAKSVKFDIDLAGLKFQASQIAKAGHRFAMWMREWRQIAVDGEPPLLQVHRINWNSRATMFNKQLLDRNGLPNRNFYKHVVFGPQVWRPDDDSNFEYNTLPGIRDAIAEGDRNLARGEVNRVIAAMKHAIEVVIR